MQPQELIPHLFRTEYSKIVAVLCRLFGLAHIEIAEDIASETFLQAVESWSYQGLPPNPTAWLYAVAKNKVKNHLKHNQVFAEKITTHIRHSSAEKHELEIDLTDSHIADSQLQMLFALCHPSISPEAQIGLSLRILCGFGIDEIADAFLVSKETIHKRLARAKEKLRQQNVVIAFPESSEIASRLQTVLTTLYLLFNEGYYSESKETVIRKDLCLEAMRLTYLLTQNPQTDVPEANALLALMCFHSSRLDARQNAQGELILYQDQDETLWNQELIARGADYFQRASQTETLSTYHLEAGIAYWYTLKTDSEEKWEAILQLYNYLLQVKYSPVAALNRTFTLAKARGNQVAIQEAEKLHLPHNRFYYTLLGELYTGIDSEKAKCSFLKAYVLAKTQTDKQTIAQKIKQLDEQAGFSV